MKKVLRAQVALKGMRLRYGNVLDYTCGERLEQEQVSLFRTGADSAAAITCRWMRAMFHFSGLTFGHAREVR